MLVVMKFHPYKTKIFSSAAVCRKVDLSCFLSHFRKGAVNSMKGERGLEFLKKGGMMKGQVLPAA